MELITSRSNRQRQEICQSYKSLYGKVTMATGGQVGWGWGADFICLCVHSGSFLFYSSSASVLTVLPSFLFSHRYISNTCYMLGHCARC